MTKAYYNTKASVQEYIKLSKGVSGVELIEKLKNFLPINSTLLELGTGPGTDWKILSADYQLTGSDYSVEFLKHLRSAFPDGNFMELDAARINTDQHFDGIYSNKVLHHLKDEDLKVSIKRQAKVLNTDGIICHSFWKGDGFEVFKGLFVNYHSEEALKAFFQSDFEIQYLAPYAEFETDDSVLLIAKKKIR